MEDDKFDDLDCREYVIGQENGYSVMLYQVEVLRLIKILETAKSNYLAQKFKRLVFMKDYKDNTKTSIDRNLPKGQIIRFLLSPKDFREYIKSQREFDKDMEGYYGKRK